MRLNSTQARELATGFRKLSVALGDFRFGNWSTLTPTQRRDLEDVEWSLLNSSSDMVTRAVGLALDETQVSLARLKSSTTKARTAVKRINKAKAILAIADLALGLAGAIASGNVPAIASSANDLYSAAT